jgi:hypothetical protein
LYHAYQAQAAGENRAQGKFAAFGGNAAPGLEGRLRSSASKTPANGRPATFLLGVPARRSCSAMTPCSIPVFSARIAVREASFARREDGPLKRRTRALIKYF